MSILLSAIALSAASPAAPAPAATPAPAVAPTPAPAPAPGKKCCCKDMAEPMACCPKHGGEAGQGEGNDAHAGHGMSH